MNNVERRILLAFNIRSNVGRDQLSGVFRFMGEHTRWVPRLISSQEEFTPEVIRNAELQGYDGIITNCQGTTGTLERLKLSPLPLAVLGISAPELKTRRHNVIFTSHGNQGSGRLAAQKFLSLGEFASYCYIHPKEVPEWSRQREKGFAEEIRSHSSSIQLSSTTISDDGKHLLDTLRTLPRPTAVLTANDYCAMEVLQLCAANDIAVPKEVSVIGSGNDEMICEHTKPPLSSIQFDFSQDGYDAAAGLERIISSQVQQKNMQTILQHPFCIVDRETTAPITPAVSLVRRARDYIKTNACKGISSRDVAMALGVSESLLALRFRELAKETVLHAITNSRIMTIQHLLLSTSRPISVITRQAGFNDINNLKRLFRRHVGVTMREYRKQHTSTPKHLASTNIPTKKDERKRKHG